MEELQQLYLIASFPDGASLRHAAGSLNLPVQHVAVLGNERSGARELAEALDLDRELEEDVELDQGQRARLAWHLERKETPLLAVRVMAAEGRDVRLRLTELGGEMLWAPGASVQANDAVLDPDTPTDDADLPPDGDNIYAPN